MPLIARDLEIDAIVSQIRRNRLVTIVGHGGVGKTALARAVAAVAGPDFAHGAVTADLTKVDDPAAVKELIAGQFGRADFQTLIDSPSEQPALLVIDNCEHVLDAAAEAIEMVLASCPASTVLATSRSPLDVADEVVVPLAPLDVPPRGEDETDATAGSVALFTERVVDHGGSVAPSDVGAVAEICRRLDGVPLALELAAARSRTHTFADMLSDLTEHRPNPAPSEPDASRTRPSVGGMVEWSLRSFDHEHRRGLQQLAVIAGPFDLEMASAVVTGRDRADVSELIDELTAASLVVADGSGPARCYRLPHPVRAVALAQLRQAGGEAEATDRAIDHIVEVASRIVVGPPDGRIDQLATLLSMYEITLASLAWSSEHDARPDRPLALLAVLGGVAHHAHTAEIAAVGEAVLARWPDPDAPFWADAAATVATCRNLHGDHDEAIDLATVALDGVGASLQAPGTLRRIVALAHRACGRLEEARDWFLAGADAAGQAGAHGLALELCVDHALLLSELGDDDSALALVDEVVAEAEQRTALANRAWALNGRGAILLRARGSDAIDAIEQGVEYSKVVGYPAGVSFGLRLTAGAHLASDHREGAATALLELLDVLLERGGLNDLRVVLDHAATLLERVGDDRWLDAAATAQAMPMTTIGAPVTSTVFEWAGGRGAVLSTRDAYRMCRAALAPIAAGEHQAAPPVLRPLAPLSSFDDNSLVVDGDTWHVTFAGESFALPATQGMDDLAMLLAAPGQEISAMDLMTSTDDAGRDDESLHARARRGLTEQIRQLEVATEQAEADNAALADRAAAERARLQDELGAADVLVGHTRTVGSDPERARTAVAQRIATTIARMERPAPLLARHLSTSVVTGTICAYCPPGPIAWSIER